MLNKKLQDELRKHFGDQPLSNEMQTFLQVISDSYDQMEEDNFRLKEAIKGDSVDIIKLIHSQNKANNDLRILFENIEEVFFSLDCITNNLLHISAACLKVYGYTQKNFEDNSKLWFEMIVDEDKGNVLSKLSHLHQGQSFLQEYRITHKDGSVRWVETKIKPTTDETGKLIRVDGVTSDITKRKHAEMANAESENKFRNLFEKMADGVYKSSHEGKFIDVNNSLVRMLGYSNREELLSIDIKSTLYFDTTERENAVMQDINEGASVFRLRKKDGSEIWVEDRGQYVTDAEGNVLYHEGILRDVTEKIKAQRAIIEANNNLKLSIERLAEAQQIAHIGSKVHDVKSGLTEYSAEFFKIFETTPEEFPETLEAYLEFFHPEERAYIRKKHEQIIVDHLAVDYESRLVMRNGSVKFIKIFAKCTVDENENLLKIVETVQDITSQKHIQIELEKNIVELEKSNSELDKFVYSVSHDLRAPLSSILGVVEMALEDTEDELMLEHLKMVNSNIKKLDGFITDILDYSRNSRMDVKKEAINFKEMLNDIAQNLKYMGDKNRKVDMKFNVNDCGALYSDRSRLNIILNNLVSNAIRYQNMSIDNPQVEVKVDMSDTETGIVIRDNGIGIKKELHEKIFDMFYRVSENSIGSGLGLYIVKEAVTKLNGKIEVESEPGVGTQFKIKIPNNTHPI
jgi:PAS domain S-box-containing protein